MSVSLTKDGLYLEPRVYYGTETGYNYGTPRFVDGGAEVSLGGGTWTGYTAYEIKEYTSEGLSVRPHGVIRNVTNAKGGIYFRVS